MEIFFFVLKLLNHTAMLGSFYELWWIFFGWLERQIFWLHDYFVFIAKYLDVLTSSARRYFSFILLEVRIFDDASYFVYPWLAPKLLLSHCPLSIVYWLFLVLCFGGMSGQVFLIFLEKRWNLFAVLINRFNFFNLHLPYNFFQTHDLFLEPLFLKRFGIFL